MKNIEIRNGSNGLAVRSWQLFLVSQGINMDDFSNSGDGSFGKGTEAGTKKYQSSKGLSSTGVVDDQTYAKAIEDGFKSEF